MSITCPKCRSENTDTARFCADCGTRLGLPEDFFFFLEKEAAEAASEEARVKGYKVKVQYQPVKEEEKKAKREAVAQVILQAMKRMKETKGP